MVPVTIKLTKLGQPRDYIIEVDDDGSGEQTGLEFVNDTWQGHLPKGERILVVFVSGEESEGLEFDVTVGANPKTVPSVIIPAPPNVNTTRTILVP